VRAFLERFFKVPEHGSTLRTELLGGATTFLTMMYIIVVNPAILAFAGIPVGPSTVATILAAVFGSLLMGLYANRPLAVAPYMGENAFIAFGLTTLLIDGEEIRWQERLGTVFVAGVVFLLLTLLRLWSWLANAISPSMKYSFAAGIGLFLLLLGLYETGIVTSSVTGLEPSKLGVVEVSGTLRVARPAVPLQIGNLRETRVLLAIFGFLLIVTLLYWRVRGGILLGIVLTATAGYALGVGEAPRAVVALPWGGDYDLTQVAFKLDIPGVLRLGFLPILITLFLISFLDTLGTLVGVGAAAGMLDEHGSFKEIEKPMLVDAVSCMFNAGP
jgi:AGZA family xanthine/uracil permease-like MFS transporter